MLFLGTGDIAIDMENQVKANATITTMTAPLKNMSNLLHENDPVPASNNIV
jgi:hypothetical protein